MTFVTPVTPDEISLLQSIFDVMVVLWEQNRERIKKIEEEENSLYKFKDRDRIKESDEEREERVFREYFPDYYESYRDLLVNPDEEPLPQDSDTPSPDRKSVV